MTKTPQTEPWRALPADIADLLEPELDAITDEILATIAREVPDYARPLEGSFGRGVRTGVTEALHQFVALIRSPSGRGPGLDPEELSLLAESIFAYIEQLSADSVEGYAEARSRLEGERRRRRRELVAVLLRDPPAEQADPRAAAGAAGLA